MKELMIPINFFYFNSNLQLESINNKRNYILDEAPLCKQNESY